MESNTPETSATPNTHTHPGFNLVVYEYEVYAGGGMIRHQFNAQGCHRLATWEGKIGEWAAYTSLATLQDPWYASSRFMFIGATEYGLLQNEKACVARVEILVPSGYAAGDR